MKSPFEQMMKHYLPRAQEDRLAQMPTPGILKLIASDF
jgi:hypothetical protein